MPRCLTPRTYNARAMQGTLQAVQAAPSIASIACGSTGLLKQ